MISFCNNVQEPLTTWKTSTAEIWNKSYRVSSTKQTLTDHLNNGILYTRLNTGCKFTPPFFCKMHCNWQTVILRTRAGDINLKCQLLYEVSQLLPICVSCIGITTLLYILSLCILTFFPSDIWDTVITSNVVLSN